MAKAKNSITGYGGTPVADGIVTSEQVPDHGRTFDDQTQMSDHGRTFDDQTQMSDHGRTFDDQTQMSDVGHLTGPTVQQLQEVSAELSVDISGGFAEIVPQALELMRVSEALAARACQIAVSVGVLLLAARADYQHGEWLAYLEKEGIPRTRAAEMMRLASRYAQLSPAARRQLISGGKVKALALTKLDEETLEAASASGDLAKLAAMPKAGLLEYVRKLVRENNAIQVRAETAEAKLAAATNDDVAPRLTRLDAARRRDKLAMHGYSELIQRTAAEMGKLVLKLYEMPPQGVDEELADKALCTGMQVEIAAAKAVMDELYGLCNTALQGRLSVQRDDVPVMSSSEVRNARERRATMAVFTQKELEASDALAYLRNELDGANARGAPPRAVKDLRRKDSQ